MSEEQRKPGSWWYWPGYQVVRMFVGINSKGEEIYDCGVSCVAVRSSTAYEIYDNKEGFDHKFVIPEVPEDYAKQWQHQTPPVFRKPTDDEHFITIYGRGVTEFIGCYSPDKPKRWILEAVPVPAEEPVEVRSLEVELETEDQQPEQTFSVTMRPPKGFEFTGEYRNAEEGEWFFHCECEMQAKPEGNATGGTGEFWTRSLILRRVQSNHEVVLDSLVKLVARAESGEITLNGRGSSAAFGTHTESFDYTVEGVADGSIRPDRSKHAPRTVSGT